MVIVATSLTGEETQATRSQPRQSEVVETGPSSEETPETRSREDVLRILGQAKKHPLSPSQDEPTGKAVTMSTPTGLPATVGRG